MLLLGRERYGACLDECAGELGEDGQVGVELDALKATDPERQYRCGVRKCDRSANPAVSGADRVCAPTRAEALTR